jgi:hypothetical protein
VSDSVDGPFKKVATVVQHEAHNPQALEFEGSFYIFHIGSGASTTPIHDCDNDRAGMDVAEAPAPAVPMGSSLHKASSPAGPFLPVKQAGVGSCNNPSPFRHPNGTLFLVCTWSIKRADRPEGPWAEVMKLTPPPKNARHWEDPFLFIDARGFHILAHVYSMEAFPSNTISGLAFSESGLDWTWSEVEPYGNAVERTDGTVDHFATMERPKLLFADASNPTHPTHIINGVSPIWDTSNATDPCHECCPAPGGGGKTRCSCCKTYPGIDWTYTLLRPLKMDESVHSDGAGAPPPPPQKGPWFSQPFVSGVGGYHSYRIPAMVTLPQKMTTGEPELLAFCEGRKLSCDDVDWNDIVIRRSTDAGRSWGRQTVVHGEGTSKKHVCIGNPSPVVVTSKPGRVVMTGTRQVNEGFSVISDDYVRLMLSPFVALSVWLTRKVSLSAGRDMGPRSVPAQPQRAAPARQRRARAQETNRQREGGGRGASQHELNKTRTHVPYV